MKKLQLNFKIGKQQLKKAKRITLDDATIAVQEKHTEHMMSIEVCKSIVEKFGISDYKVIRSSGIPGISIKFGDHVEAVCLFNKTDTISVACQNGSNEVLFNIPMRDNYLDQIEKIFDLMPFISVNYDEDDMNEWSAWGQ